MASVFLAISMSCVRSRRMSQAVGFWSSVVGLLPRPSRPPSSRTAGSIGGCPVLSGVACSLHHHWRLTQNWALKSKLNALSFRVLHRLGKWMQKGPGNPMLSFLLESGLVQATWFCCLNFWPHHHQSMNLGMLDFMWRNVRCVNCSIPRWHGTLRGIVLDLVSTSRVKAWGPHTRRKKCEELASVTWPSMTNPLIDATVTSRFSFNDISQLLFWTCYIFPVGMFRNRANSTSSAGATCPCPSQRPWKEFSRAPEFDHRLTAFLFFQWQFNVSFPSPARSAKPTLGRLLAMMDLRRHLARTSFCVLSTDKPRASDETR